MASEAKRAEGGAAWTPGPWAATYEDDEGHAVLMGEAIESPGRYASHLKWTCDFTFDEEWDDDSPAMREQFTEAEANARLIAAAPDLAAALARYVDLARRGRANTTDAEWDEAYGAAEEALTKATEGE